MKRGKIILSLLGLIILWMVVDIYYPFKSDMSAIDPTKTANTETAMWRAYYDKKPATLYIQSAALLRQMFHVPFWRSYLIAYYNAKAAFIFKDGHSRLDYEEALPYLTRFYQHISDISEKPFNADSVARSDLEWWIIRRYRQEHPPAEWEKYISMTAARMYHLPADRFIDYARLQVEAMLLRDEHNSSMTENDWRQVNRVLVHSWQAFAADLHR